MLASWLRVKDIPLIFDDDRPVNRNACPLQRKLVEIRCGLGHPEALGARPVIVGGAKVGKRHWLRSCCRRT